MSERATSHLLDIHEYFAATKYGRDLSAQVRYNKYKPTEISNKQWVELLGPDVNNLTHMTFTFELAGDFVADLRLVQPGMLTEDEAELLLVAALIHDWAESVKGDISYGDKTLTDEQEEAAIFEALLPEFYQGDAYALVDQAREVVFDHDGVTKLGKMFNAVERLGYIHTTLCAVEHIFVGDTPECESNFTWLVADVLSLQTEALLSYSRDYAPVKNYLDKRRDLISQAFDLIDAHREIFEKYGERQNQRLEAFKQSARLWRAEL